MPSRNDILIAFDRINVWSRGSERAPHKPPLVLYALGQLSRGGPNLVAFRDLSPRLIELLKEFGPTRQSYHPEYPFWRLQNDGVWIVDDAEQLERRTGQTDIPKRELLDKDAHSHFTDEIAQRLERDPSLAADVALRLLDGHFPVSIHQDILDAVGLDLSLTETVTRRKRDPAFRGRILTAYEYACAVCGYDVKLGSQIMGLEAAHIKWHQAGGPDEEQNGLALCSLHHKAFDLGAFIVRTPDEERRIRIKYASAHDLHRSLAERLYNRGMTAETLMVIMRHRDFATTRKFYQAKKRAEAAAAEVHKLLAGDNAEQGFVGGHEKAPQLSAEQLLKLKRLLNSL